MRTAESHTAREAVLWFAVACILAAAIGFSWNPTPFAQALAAIFIACALVHAGFFYGFRSAPILFVICVAITFVMENIGAATGFPFGHYHFEVDAGLPHIGSIPIIVGPFGLARATSPGSSLRPAWTAPIGNWTDHST